MKKVTVSRENKSRKNARERRVVKKPEVHELNPTHNLPDNLKKALAMLKEALGEEWATDDPAVTCAYARDQSFTPAVYPHIVCLPASTEEVREVYRIANECLVDVMPYGTGISTVGATITQYGGILCDLGRMDQILEIDGRNLYARIQPGVRFCDLQVEAQKVGARLTNPSTSATAGVISNMVACNINTMACKYGFGCDNVIEVVMVLPTGEILETGPRSCGMIPAHAPGPGPDVSNLYRYSLGTLGVVTEMTIRLYPQPAFEKAFFASHNEDRLDEVIDALYVVAQENQAIELAHLQNTFFGNFMAETNREAERLVGVMPRNNIMAIFGGSTEEEAQLKVDTIGQAVLETSPIFELLDADYINELADSMGIHTDRWLKYMRETVRVQRVKGSFLIGALVDHLDNFKGIEREMRRVTTSQVGTNDGVFRPDDASAYFQPYHMGRMAYLEYDLYSDQSTADDTVRMNLGYFRATLSGMAKGAIFAAGLGAMLKGIPKLDLALPLIMPNFTAYMEAFAALKKELDPNNISNRRWNYDTGEMSKISIV